MDGHWAGCRAVGDATCPQQKERGSSQSVWFTPAPGSPRHQSRGSVTHTQSAQEFPPSPTGGNALGPHPAPVPDLPGEGLPAGAGMDPAGYRALAAAYLPSSRSFPTAAERGHRLCRAGAGPIACPQAPREPHSTDPRELRDGRIFSRRNARFSLYLIPACSGWVAMELTAVPGCERVWGRKGLTRGSLLTLSNDLNQTERFCHPSR